LKPLLKHIGLLAAIGLALLLIFASTRFIYPRVYYSVIWRVQNLFPQPQPIYSPPASLSLSSFEYIEIDPDVAGDCKAVGDIDGDGLPDLIVGGLPQEQLNWYRNPTWQKFVIATPLIEFTTDCALGDINANGYLDIVVPDGDSGDNLVWFQNPAPHGDPASGEQWMRHTIGPVAGWGKDVKLADFDGDGRLDVATRNNQQAMIFFQAAPNQWERVLFSGFQFGHEGMASGDIDGDGHPDLVLQGVWLRNPGGQTARNPNQWLQYPIGPADPAFKALLVDLNQDGHMDVVFSSSENTANVVWWSPDDGDPTGPWQQHLVFPALERAHTLQAADMNNNGHIDLVVGQMHTSARQEIMIFFNLDGQATNWQQQVIATGGLHNGVVADMDGDGLPDLFGANWAGNPPVKLWLNRLNSLDHWSYHQVTDQHHQTFGLAFADIDGDGLTDIISGGYWYRNPGPDLLGHWQQTPLPAGMHAILALFLHDNLPGLIAQKDEGDLALYWLEATDRSGQSWNAVKIGSLPAASHSIGAQGYRLAQVEPGDHPQVLVASGQGVFYFRIPANPVAGDWPRVHLSSNPSDEGFALGDIDGDGLLDLAATTGGTRRVEWYHNPGDGSQHWPAFHIGDFAEALYPDRTEVADLNGDGRLDIIVSEENGESSGAETYWWEQPADPTSANWTRHLITSQGSTNSMDVADMNGDGYPDLVLAEHSGPLKLSIWYNDGRGNFSEQVILLGKESHLGARVVDLNDNGSFEIVSIAWDDFTKIHFWIRELTSSTSE
jgi:hypothetical protein